MKIFIVGNNNISVKFIDNAEVVGSIESAEMVIFAGRDNLSAEVCGVEDLPGITCNYKNDVEEMGQFFKAMDSPNVKLILGLNRGANLLCALNGGGLIQKVSNHSLFGLHLITNGKEDILMTSDHDQMQYPFSADKFTVLYWAHPKRSDYYEGYEIDFTKDDKFVEPEIVLYETFEKKCLAIQGNPERMNARSTAVRMINNLISKYAG